MKVRRVENPATPRVTRADIPDMVKALTETFHRSTFTQLMNGHAWYERARRIAVDIAGEDDVRTGAGLLGAYSQATGWKLTVRYARNMYATRRDQPTIGEANRRARRILDGEDFEGVLGIKTRNFARAITGDSDAVVIDRWAIRAAVGGTWERVTDRQYEVIAEAYREAARLADVTPAAMQAVTWLVTRGETGWDMD